MANKRKRLIEISDEEILLKSEQLKQARLDKEKKKRLIRTLDDFNEDDLIAKIDEVNTINRRKK